MHIVLIILSLLSNNILQYQEWEPVPGAIIFNREGGIWFLGGPEFFGVVKGGDQIFFQWVKGGTRIFWGSQRGGPEFFPRWPRGDQTAPPVPVKNDSSLIICLQEVDWQQLQNMLLCTMLLQNTNQRHSSERLEMLFLHLLWLLVSPTNHESP